MLKPFKKNTDKFKNILPSPFSIAVLLTFITFALALIIKSSKSQNLPILEILNAWEQGVWNPPMLVFTVQMILMLVLGYTLAITNTANKIINKVVIYCNNTATSAAIVTFLSVIVSLFNWGLGLIFGAILARKVGEHAKKNNLKINYPLIGASGYSGLMVWHGGISGSAPIKIAEEGHFLQEKIGIISTSETIFSEMNIYVSVFLILFLPIIMYFIGRKSQSKTELPSSLNEENNIINAKGAEKLDHSKIIGYLFGGFIFLFIFYKTFVLPEKISLKIINPNYINLLLFSLAIIMHGTFYNFIKALNKAITSASGILIQFPLYFGIMGIMQYSEMIPIISGFFIVNSNEFTFPIFTLVSAGLVNCFIPSGGGQWAIQGPIIIEAANQLNISISKSIMALAYGDQLTNMLQPFWALPLLGITGLKAKEILPYTLILFFAGIIIFTGGLILF